MSDTPEALPPLDALFRENAIPMNDRNGALYDAISAALAQRQQVPEARMRETLEFIAQHFSSDWPERCQSHVLAARHCLTAAPSAQAEPVAFTSQHQIEELRARKAGFAGRPDYLYAHAEPGGIYTVPLYAAPPTAQAEPLRAHLSRARAMMQAFCDRVDAGQVRSVKTYSAFKAFLEETRDV